VRSPEGKEGGEGRKKKEKSENRPFSTNTCVMSEIRGGKTSTGEKSSARFAKWGRKKEGKREREKGGR